MDYSKLIENEIADFFTGFGGPGEPDIQSGEAQQQLTERLLSVLALRERAEPVAYISKADLDAGYPHILARKEYSKAFPMAVYSSPPAPVVVPDIDRLKEIYSIFCTPTAGSDNAMVAIHNACRAAMLKPPIQHTTLREGLNALRELGAIDAEKIFDEREALKDEQPASEGFMCVPVADLYELIHKGGEAYSYTSSASDAVYWVKEGYTVREYVLLDRLQDAMNHPIDTTSQQYEALSRD